MCVFIGFQFIFVFYPYNLRLVSIDKTTFTTTGGKFVNPIVTDKIIQFDFANPILCSYANPPWGSVFVIFSVFTMIKV